MTSRHVQHGRDCDVLRDGENHRRFAMFKRKSEMPQPMN